MGKRATEEELEEVISDNDTVADARLYVNARLDDGVTCPVCRKHVQRRRRMLTKAMVRTLKSLVRLTVAGQVFEFSKLPVDLRGGDYAKLRYFGLIKRGSGIFSNKWLVTDDGIDFVNGVKPVPKWVILDRGQVINVSKDMIWIGDYFPNFSLNDTLTS